MRQRGVALITAIVVVAIATVLAVRIGTRAALDLRRTAGLVALDQGWHVALGAEAWAAEVLSDDYDDDPETDHLGEAWAQPLPPLPVDGGEVRGALEDMQGRFNLNNLVNAAQEPDEERRPHQSREDAERNLDRRKGACQRVDEQQEAAAQQRGGGQQLGKGRAHQEAREMRHHQSDPADDARRGDYVVHAAQNVVDRLLDEEAHNVRCLSEQVKRAIRVQVEPSYGPEQFDVVLAQDLSR